MLRSVLAVATGYMAMAAAVLATDLLLGAMLPDMFSDPAAMPTWYEVFNHVMNFAWGVLGGYVAARVAPRAEIVHALALGLFAELLGILGLLQALGTPRVWYSVIVLLIVLPATLLGGWLRARQLARRGPEPEGRLPVEPIG